jgi:hypothetical protein
MDIQPFPGFKHFPTHHCVTGSLRHIYEFNGFPISEEMLLGLGAGVGFMYWHTKGTPPFLGGRGNTGRPGEPGLEQDVGERTGVRVEAFRTGSAAKAERILLEMLEAGRPVMLLLDMGFLPYFDFGGEEFHFGYHSVVACGLDAGSRKVLLADRDEELHPVSLDDLARARGSKFKPFPPRHTWFTFDFSGRRPPTAEVFLGAIGECARAMLEPPIRNFGVKGIRTAAERIRAWPKVLSAEMLRLTCINTAIMIDHRGGSGGGLFRYMYGRFLSEAAGLTGRAELVEVAECMERIGDGWEAVAGGFERAAAASEPRVELEEICAQLPGIADQEDAAWEMLEGVASSELLQTSVSTPTDSISRK